MGSVMLLAAAGDVRMLVRGGVFGVQRSCGISGACALGCSSPRGRFSGTGQGIPLSIAPIKRAVLPAILPLILLIFWLFRVRFTNAYKGKSMPGGSDVYSLRT
jgi:hypothetical protein